MYKSVDNYKFIDTFISVYNINFNMTEENLVLEKAERIRDVIRYIRKFKNALVIIYLDDRIIDSPQFLNHIRDIGLIHESGLNVIIVPGAEKRITEILDQQNITWTRHNNCRITGPEAMPLIKMAAFDVSNQIMTALAGEKLNAVIGNWVRARGKGIIDGFDYGTSGEIDKLQIEAIKTVLNNGFIPIFPCIGWSFAGKPYNISSIQLARQIAVHLQADKLFYLLPDSKIDNQTYNIPETIGVSPEGNVPAMNLEELELFLKSNKSLFFNSEKDAQNNSNSLYYNDKQPTSNNYDKTLLLLTQAREACVNGVSRIHILNGSLNGTIPCEIFSDLGSGTMIYESNYGGIRNMTSNDINAVLNVMQPFIDEGILLPRTKASLSKDYVYYVVYELDGAIRACASLIPYSDGQMEIAGIAVDKSCSHIGIGPKMISYLLDKAKKFNAKNVFLLTTRTSDWFENLGFKETSLDNISEQRKAKWTPKRGSKAYIYDITSQID